MGYNLRKFGEVGLRGEAMGSAVRRWGRVEGR